MGRRGGLLEYNRRKMRNGNRRPVSLVRRGEEGSGKLLESGLGQHVSVFLECERQRLRSLDKATAKKIIGNAERNLMHFMKSKAKVNCFRSPSRQTSYNNVFAHPLQQTNTLFDPKQLKAYLEHEQRKHKHPPTENAPLIDSSLRQLQ